MKHHFNNQTIQKERVGHKVVWEEIQNEISEGQTPPQNAGSWPLTKQRLLFYKNFLGVFYMYKFWPHHIISVNESGCSDVQVSPPVIIPKGQKNIKIATILRKAEVCDVLWALVDCWYHSLLTTPDSWRSPWNYLFAQNQDGWRKMWLSCDSNI